MGIRLAKTCRDGLTTIFALGLGLVEAADSTQTARVSRDVPLYAMHRKPNDPPIGFIEKGASVQRLYDAQGHQWSLIEATISGHQEKGWIETGALQSPPDIEPRHRDISAP